ncbi:MAG: hypothetical protein AMXMBFR82_07930 [Candidatus Hydrogenedentota bacterium]
MKVRLLLLGLLGALLAAVVATILFRSGAPDRPGGESVENLSRPDLRVTTVPEPYAPRDPAPEVQPVLDSSNSGCSVTGLVLSATGPAASVSVLARVRDGNVLVDHVATQTDELGQFEIADLPAGMCDLVARSTAAIGSFTVRLTPTEPVAQVRIILQSGKPLAGRIDDPEGKPVPGAEVVPYARDGDELGARGAALAVHSSAEGRFAFDLLDGRFWRFRISAAGFAPVVTDPIETGTDSAVVQLAFGGSVSGTVVHASDRSPVPGVVVGVRHKDGIFNDWFARTGDAGGFDFTGLAPGSYSAYLDDDVLVLEKPVEFQLSAADPAHSEIEVLVSSGVSVEGRVFDADSSQAIAGAIVLAFPSDRPGRKRESAATDKSGGYQIANVHYGAVRLAVTELPVQYTSGITYQNVVLAPDADLAVVDFPLKRSITVSGTVVDGAGAGVAGAQVFARVPNLGGPRGSTTNRSGAFTIAGVSTGDEVYLSAKTSETLAPEIGPFPVPAEGLSGIEIVLSIETGASIAGIVTDNTGMPAECVVFAELADASMAKSLGRLSSETGPDGHFTIAGLAAGSYDLILGAQDLHLVQGICHAGTVQVAPGQHATGIRLVYETDPLTEISGRVTDQEGEAIARTQVTAASKNLDDTLVHVAYTGEDGTYVMSGLTGETYRLDFVHEQFASAAVNDVVTGSRGVDVVLQSRPTISGTVIEERDGRPVTQFQIAVVPGRRPEDGVNLTGATFLSVNDSLGRFQIEADSGSRILVARATGFAQQATAVGRIQPGQSVDGIVVVLSRDAYRLEGVVRDSVGQAVSHAVVSATGEKDLTTTEVQTGSDGRFVLDGLSAGNVYLFASHPDYGANRVVAASSQEPGHPVEIVLLEFGSLVGTVTLIGDPLPEATVTLVGDLGMRSVSAQTGVNGDFEFASVPSGAAVVQVRAILPNQTDAATFEQEVFVVPGEPTPLEIALETN